jgi:hypothetical protein
MYSRHFTDDSRRLIARCLRRPLLSYAPREYHYLCESFWADGKPRQRVLAYLGQYKTVMGAHAYWCKQVNAGQDAAARKHARKMVQKLAEYL